ncbi:MAG: hypothetical protein Q9202_002797 [Teloschistes flavicans]
MATALTANPYPGPSPAFHRAPQHPPSPPIDDFQTKCTLPSIQSLIGVMPEGASADAGQQVSFGRFLTFICRSRCAILRLRQNPQQCRPSIGTAASTTSISPWTRFPSIRIRFSLSKFPLPALTDQRDYLHLPTAKSSGRSNATSILPTTVAHQLPSSASNGPHGSSVGDFSAAPIANRPSEPLAAPASTSSLHFSLVLGSIFWPVARSVYLCDL